MIKLYEQYIKELNDIENKINITKNAILITAIETKNLSAVKFFVERNYNINDYSMIKLIEKMDQHIKIGIKMVKNRLKYIL